MSLTKTSRLISYILRHNPSAYGVTLDTRGWASVEELILGVNRARPLTREQLEYIVSADEKRRYSFNEDKTKIRANQGHSVDVDVELEESCPPRTLYHGTATKHAQSIEEKGLISGRRLYVHLSGDIETALKVGARHGEPVVYRVDAERMAGEGYVFFRSENGVWLTKAVPPRFLSRE